VLTTKWENEIVLEGIGTVRNITMPGYAGKIRFRQKNGRLAITAPALNPGNMPCRFAWVFKLENGIQR
jgi:alpha-L-fucosidase